MCFSLNTQKQTVPTSFSIANPLGFVYKCLPDNAELYV